ncbi:unnamed protein product [Linum tenue]|uniref:DUF4220 domain-containing protein n=1 Tax=Linum tenue TaxID=586396 RepID=A0AAV0PCV4_9ROSI|nr:unnamed protein product [Linum tenue]
MMLQTVAAATILADHNSIRRRSTVELFPPSWRKLWKEWELRALVLISLSLQILLIISGNRRRFKRSSWLQFTTWSAYLLADWVAAVALGVLLNNLGDLYEDDPSNTNSSKPNSATAVTINPETQLTAFWAPFLLLHLGGPDTITSYALEDNELWLRHLMGLAVQTGMAIYIFLLAWTVPESSRLSLLTLPIFAAGLIKYGERTYALMSASNNERLDSLLTEPDPGPNYSKFMEELTLKQYEGFNVQAQEVPESRVLVVVNDEEGMSNPKANRQGKGRDETEQLIYAHQLFDKFKRLFVDLILSFQDRDDSQSLFQDISYQNAFKVIEIELGFMYDELYTKARIIYTTMGYCFRFVTLSSTCVALAIFSASVGTKRPYKNDMVDVVVTFQLLASAIFLELYAGLSLVSSDWMDLLLVEHKISALLRKFISFVQMPKLPRWSNSMGQYNLISFCLRTKPKLSQEVTKSLWIDKLLETRHETSLAVSEELKEFIFDHFKDKFLYLKQRSKASTSGGGDDELARYQKELKSVCTWRGNRVLERMNHQDLLPWTVDLEFDQSILVWHIATDLCYQLNPSSEFEVHRLREKSKQLSEYMMYLLVTRPVMLPMGIGKIRYIDTCAEIRKVFQDHEAVAGRIRGYGGESRNPYKWIFDPSKLLDGESGASSSSSEAWEVLLNVNTGVPAERVKGDRCKSVLFEACRLAERLRHGVTEGERWELVSNVWVEMLGFAASHCRGSYHAQHLRLGGELLTHVWLLMAHFGITEQFQISRGHARAKLSVR